MLKTLGDREWHEHARWIAGATVDASGPQASHAKSRRSPRPDAPPQVLTLADVAMLLNTYTRRLLRVSRGASDALVTVEHEVLRLVRELVAVSANGKRSGTEHVRRALWSLAPQGQPRTFDARLRLVAYAALLPEHPDWRQLRYCAVCPTFFVDRSRSAKARTCSDRCRKRLERDRVRSD